MRNIYIVFALTICCTGAKAQKLLTNTLPLDGLQNTNLFMDATNFNADANSLGKGLGFPNANLTTFTFDTAVADNLVTLNYFDGMLVYNNASGSTMPGQGIVTAVTPGFYYFKNSGNPSNITNGQWRRVLDISDFTEAASVADATTSTKGIVQLAGDLTGTAVAPLVGDNKITSAKIMDGTIALSDMGNNSVDTSKIVDGSILNIDLADNAITTEKIADGTITLTDMGNNSVDSSKIVNGSVMTVDIADNAVTVAKLPAGATATTFLRGDGTWVAAPAATVADATTTAKGIVQLAGDLSGTAAAPVVADNAITSAKILDGTIARADLANNVINSAKIANGTVALIDMDDDSVDSSKILDGSILTTDLANNAVTVAKLPAGATATTFLRGDGTWAAVTTTVADATATAKGILKLTGDLSGTADLPVVANDAITTAKIADGTITLADMGNNSVNSSRIVDGSILTTDLSDDAVTSAKIADGTITLTDMGNSSVNSSKIVDGSVMTIDVADNAITVAKLPAGATATTFLRGDGTWATVTAGGTVVDATATAKGIVQLAGDLSGTAAAPTVANNAITSAKIADGTVALVDMANNSVDTSKIVDGSVMTVDLSDNAVTSAKIVDGTVALVDMANNSIDTSKIVDGSVMAADIADNAITVAKLPAGATATTFLRGDGTWGTPAAAAATTASNGLMAAANNIKLGGALTEATTISGLTATNRLAITGTGIDAFNVDSNTLSVDAASDRVGIGTAAPITALHVVGPSSTIASGGENNAQLIISPAGNLAGRLTLGYDNTTGVGLISAFQSGSTAKNLVLQPGISGGNSVNVLVGWDGVVDNGFKFQVLGSTLLRGALKVVDGTQGAGKVLTSDANGLASWQTPSTSAGTTIEPWLNGGTTTGADNNSTSIYFGKGNVGFGTSTPKNLIDMGTTLGKKLAVYQSGDDFYGLGISAGTLEFHAGATAAKAAGMVLTGAGNVGIGTTTPLGKFDIQGTGGLTGMVRFDKSGTNTPFVAAGYDEPNDGFAIVSNVAGTDVQAANTRLFVNRQSGNIGIGTVAPAAKLDIAGNIKITDGTQGAGKVLTSDANGLATWTTPTTGGGTAAEPLRNAVSLTGADNTSTNIVYNAGNFGLNMGAVAPVNKLHVKGGALVSNVDPALSHLTSIPLNENFLNITTATATASGLNTPIPVLRMADPGVPGNKWASVAEFRIGTYSGDGNARTRFDLRLSDTDHFINTGSARDVMTWLANGKVGIGTTAPATTLEVNGSATNTKSVDATSTADFTGSNLAATTTQGAYTLTGIKDGGTYTLACQTAGSVSQNVTSGVSGITTKLAYTAGAAVTAYAHAVYTIVVIKSTAYIYFTPFN